MYFPLRTHILVLIALLGASNGTQIGGIDSGAIYRPDDTSSAGRRGEGAAPAGRRLQGSGRRGRVAWKRSSDADAVIRRSDQSARAANGTTGARIAWGQDLPYGRYPFVAYLFADGIACTGSLVAPRVVLTAAHCVYKKGEWSDPDNSYVLLGGVDINDMKAYSVVSFSIPGSYEVNEDFYGDVALVELAKPADGIKPAQMAVPNINLSKVTFLVAVGWGLTEDGETSEVARYTRLTLFSNLACNGISRETFGTDMEEDKVCFGLNDEPAVSVCEGDSGGPLIARNSKGPVVVAITSYGEAYCGETPVINMGTTVSYWRDYLEGLMSFGNMKGRNPPSKSNTLEYGQCYQGSVIGKLTTTAWRCVEKCRSSASCSAWTHEYDTDRCTLFRSADRYYEDENCTSGYF